MMMNFSVLKTDVSKFLFILRKKLKFLREEMLALIWNKKPFVCTLFKKAQFIRKTLMLFFINITVGIS
jgi:hypothetical protein